MTSPIVKERSVDSSQRCVLAVQICLTQKAVYLLSKFDDLGSFVNENLFGIVHKGGTPFLRHPPLDSPWLAI